MRRRLRGLVQFIDKRQRKPVYTDFEDLMGGETGSTLPGSALGTDEAKFRAKARAFLREHLDHVAIHKLRTNKPLTAADLARTGAHAGRERSGDRRRYPTGSGGVAGARAVRAVARGAGPRRGQGGDGGVHGGKTLTANQIEFVNLIVDHLTEHGVMDPARSTSRRSRTSRHGDPKASSRRPTSRL